MRTRATVIVYHGVGAAPPNADPYHLLVLRARFEAQLDFLARRRQVVDLEAVVAGQPRTGKPAVAITFDDGYESVVSVAAPILREHGFRATVFVPTKWIGADNGWEPDSRPRLAIMDADELREAVKLGVEVGSHGHTHIDFEVAAEPQVAADLRESRERLVEILGTPPRYLAYPWGRSSVAARNEAAAAGFEAAFSIDRREEGGYALGRVGISGLDTEREFALKTSGRYLEWAYSRPGSLARSAIRLMRGRGDSPKA